MYILLQGVFIKANEINSNYKYYLCESWLYSNLDNAQCLSYALVDVEVSPLTPPFTYTNLCGSVIITTYIPIFIYMYIINLFFITCVPYILCQYTKYSNFPVTLKKLFDGMMWPNHNWFDKTDETNSVTHVTEPRQLLKVDNITTDILHHISILITFGLCSPILAMLICVYVCVYVIVLMILLGRFILISQQNGNISEALLLLDKTSLHSFDYISTGLRFILCMSSIFFALLCLDMACDRVHWNEAVWLPLLSISISISILLFYYLYEEYYMKESTVTIQSTHQNGDSLIEGHKSPQISKDIELRPSTFSSINTRNNHMEQKIISDEILSPMRSFQSI
jgi:hypothetical protein